MEGLLGTKQELHLNDWVCSTIY